jgi:hypothetical protein
MSRRKRNWSAALALVAVLLLPAAGAGADPLAAPGGLRLAGWWEAVLAWLAPASETRKTVEADTAPTPPPAATQDDPCSNCSDIGGGIDPNG